MPEKLPSVHYVPEGGGCQGNEAAYYSATYWASDGTCVMANGATDAEALQKAYRHLEEKERFIALPPQEKLDEICAKTSICQTDMETAIRCIHAILKGR